MQGWRSIVGRSSGVAAMSRNALKALRAFDYPFPGRAEPNACGVRPVMRNGPRLTVNGCSSVAL